jgi:hypothetical protein
VKALFTEEEELAENGDWFLNIFKQTKEAVRNVTLDWNT